LGRHADDGAREQLLSQTEDMAPTFTVRPGAVAKSCCKWPTLSVATAAPNAATGCNRPAKRCNQLQPPRQTLQPAATAPPNAATGCNRQMRMRTTQVIMAMITWVAS
jgi:hypothetical protein